MNNNEWRVMDLRKNENIPEEGKQIVFLWETVKTSKDMAYWLKKYGYKTGEGKIYIEHCMNYYRFGTDSEPPKYWLNAPAKHRIRSGFTWKYAE